jgi:tetratricopeptide (TPR) repeat protein
MARSVVEANAAIGRIRAMPYGRARSEAAERELRRIEREGPDDARAYALTSLVEALTWGDECDKAFRPFAQLLHWWDEHPELFDRYDQSVMFWEFGWIMSDLPQLPTVPKEHIDATLDDMERRFAVADRGLERVWTARLDWALLRGAPDAGQVVTHWLTLPVDEEDSCAACHEALRAEYLLWSGDRPGAIAVLEGAIAADIACSREPAAMLTELALAYLNEGRLAAVEEVVPRALAELRKAISTSLSSAYARVFEIYGRGHRLDLALPLLAERIKDTSTGTPYRQLVVLRRVVAGTAALQRAGFALEPVNLVDVPATTVAELHDWALDRTTDLTDQFDRRNGTAEQTRRLVEATGASPTERRLEFALPPTPGTSASAERLLTEQLGAALTTPPVDPGNCAVNVRPSRAAAEAALEENPAAAAQAFELAAGQAQDDGLLRESGWAWAEAGHCYQTVGDLAAAAQAYDAALSRLRAAAAPVEELARILVTWAPGVRAEEYEAFVRIAQESSALLPSILTDRPDGPNLTDLAGFGLTYRPIRRQLRARADIEDAIARVLATWGGWPRREEASAMARSAAEVYLSVGATVDAAHAHWLLGRLSEAAGADSVAIEEYRLAVQWFGEAGRREAGRRHAVGLELANILQRTGTDLTVEEILADLADSTDEPDKGDLRD